MNQRDRSCVIEVRVRYVECDPMGYVHHTVYPVWFEMARTELLRRAGLSYAELEKRGVFIVVARMNVSYRSPALYDDVLSIMVKLTRAEGARIEHDYEIRRGGELLCSGSTVLACVDEGGNILPVPDVLRS